MQVRKLDHLPRLNTAFYMGGAFIHWVFTMRGRAVGWLDDCMHAHLRELMLHAVWRYHLLCPVYCLMPDHMHILFVGVSPESDQKKAVAFLRRHVNNVLEAKGVCLQKQAYDHVLREHERECSAFEKVAWYVLENPVRAGLAEDRAQWPWSGCVVPGRPGWNVFHGEFWPAFWVEYEAVCRRESHALSAFAGLRRDKSGAATGTTP